MKEGKKDTLTNPSQERAAALQVKYEMGASSMDQDNRRLRLFEELELKPGKRIDKKGPEALKELIKTNGLYFIRYPGHAMAAKIAPSAFYFFDPDEGLFKFPKGTDLEKYVAGEYAKQMKKEWSLFPLT